MTSDCLAGVIFEPTTLSNTPVRWETLEAADFRCATFGDQTVVFDECSLSDLLFGSPGDGVSRDPPLSNVKWSHCRALDFPIDFRRAELNQVRMEACDFSWAMMNGLEDRGSVIRGTNLEGDDRTGRLYVNGRDGCWSGTYDQDVDSILGRRKLQGPAADLHRGVVGERRRSQRRADNFLNAPHLAWRRVCFLGRRGGTHHFGEHCHRETRVETVPEEFWHNQRGRSWAGRENNREKGA